MQGSPLTKVFVDSGTTYFTAPKEMFNEVTSHMPEAKCKEVENYKPMVYVLRGAGGDTFELVITQDTYMVGAAHDENFCRPAFMPLDVNNKYGPALILGEVFMRHFFTVFSRGDGDDKNAKIGFAQAKIGAPVKVAGAAPTTNSQAPGANAAPPPTNSQTPGANAAPPSTNSQTPGANAVPPTTNSQTPGANAFNDDVDSADLAQEKRKHNRDSVNSLSTPSGAHRYAGQSLQVTDPSVWPPRAPPKAGLTRMDL